MTGHPFTTKVNQTDPTDLTDAHVRIELIAGTLNLPHAEVVEATASDEGLIAFARRHNQSLDWILEGDVLGMICKLKNRPPSEVLRYAR